MSRSLPAVAVGAVGSWTRPSVYVTEEVGEGAPELNDQKVPAVL